MVEFLLVWVGIIIGSGVSGLLTHRFMSDKLLEVEAKKKLWERQYELARVGRGEETQKRLTLERKLGEAKFERGDYKMRLERSRAEGQRLKSLMQEARDLLFLAEDEPHDEESE